MNKEIHVQVTKSLLIYDEDELLNCLSKTPELFAKAIQKGKQHKRLERMSQYEKSRTDWMNEDIEGKR